MYNSVTAVGDTTDQNSYWQVKGKTDTQCQRGTPVECGSTIRLLHVATRRNLHSHDFQSPLSHNQEVSCFGEDGEGDAGDNWVVVCSTQQWRRNDAIRLKHVVSEKFLAVPGDVYGRPIHGQKEVCAQATDSRNNKWKSMEGIYIKPNEEHN
ncbi:putative stromal cell-derived factor 2 [Apostichopus japonicus]|uniref:Putative stromal cell-derived factor 2 n=1 Tax=Stichopus japonicus TaxID=307972 RepID=A0A2G8K4Q4_STIJA|nr:putative stromal cell-derived factor 2 [Apostichopus japonicus]